MSKRAVNAPGSAASAGHQGNDHAGAGAGAADAPEHEIARVHRMPGHVHLGRQAGESRGRDLEVDVRRARGIGDRLDGAEPVAPVRAGGRASEALETGIAPGGRLGSGVIMAKRVRLPNLDVCGDRAGVAVEDAAFDIQDLSLGPIRPAAAR